MYVQQNFTVAGGGLASGATVYVGKIDISKIGPNGAMVPSGDFLYTSPQNFLVLIQGDGDVSIKWNAASLAAGDYSLLLPDPQQSLMIGSGLSSSDSAGNVLPSDFDSLAVTFTRNPSGSIATESRTNGANTWVQTYARDGSDNVTGISKWMKS